MVFMNIPFSIIGFAARLPAVIPLLRSFSDEWLTMKMVRGSGGFLQRIYRDLFKTYG
jgi:hypothetical protein